MHLLCQSKLTSDVVCSSSLLNTQSVVIAGAVVELKKKYKNSFSYMTVFTYIWRFSIVCKNTRHKKKREHYSFISFSKLNQALGVTFYYVQKLYLIHKKYLRPIKKQILTRTFCERLMHRALRIPLSRPSLIRTLIDWKESNFLSKMYTHVRDQQIQLALTCDPMRLHHECVFRFFLHLVSCTRRKKIEKRLVSKYRLSYLIVVTTQ